ncbi:hypothetical protein [Nostoc sp.]|uniref:hypothetical protein n=1 Tax=Nostoc sp. TaxID=1180 RepID=UPI002FFA9797
MKKHFQPEAGNKVLKGFALKLTPIHRCAAIPHVASQQEPVPINHYRIYDV